MGGRRDHCHAGRGVFTCGQRVWCQICFSSLSEFEFGVGRVLGYNSNIHISCTGRGVHFSSRCLDHLPAAVQPGGLGVLRLAGRKFGAQFGWRLPLELFGINGIRTRLNILTSLIGNPC